MPIDFSQLVTAADKFAQAKASAHAAVNRLRDQKETEGFEYLGKIFQSDERSVARIYGAVQTAQAALAAGQPFEIHWATEDNSIVELDAEAALGMSVALAMHSNRLHQHGRALKAQIDAASTQAELDAIDVEGGWPE